MRKFTGYIATNKVGSQCEFEFEMDDDATEEEIEEVAKNVRSNGSIGVMTK